ncbi:hypothetical protein CBU95_004122 [Salmonella enterica subsp. enterica serovar Solt]|uniref:hypothetical protein n=1 Tax=Salmonella enterica TaxID=28901 RepID=UPI000B506B31|nr:hypothetical protein [Salmonella enterica]EBP9660147.1 hypothetical protein [Salmonella enterica subsp. enterica]EBV4609834.1 hypothetical protein [Salmonella enterica subsp. enterica serovar Solt]EBW3572480.1 hypothetical protein [Salmonella enterica subsp. enterica serovar Agona]ASE02866.1 hypothetical protein LFZ40_19005 [Salmonella enterica subsp. enterica serovar Quebec str. S-1267]ECB1545840.1 hypothetical protein [Salmonella enterica subsp. enterica serovar Solt]
MKFFILFLHSLEEKFHAKDHEMEMFQERTKSTAPDKLSSGTVSKAIKSNKFINIVDGAAQNAAS